jgi:uncharacterized protein Veg
MATKYKSQVTNKWIGSRYRGLNRHVDARTTEMGQIVSALRNDLTPAMNNWGDKYIEKKETAAGAKMDELYAKGWKTKDIQKAILNNKIPELSNQYVKNVVDTHSGRFEAANTIRQIEANLDAYDYKDGTKTIEEFWKPYLPNFNEASTEFTVGFSAVFNEFAANTKIKDAQNRAEHAHTVKIDKAINFMDTTTTIADIKNGKYFKQLMTLNDEMPFDGKGKAYFFDTNELNEEIALGHVLWLADTATTTEQLDKALILLTQNRGKGKGNNELGSLANTYSKQSRELILENDGRQATADAEKKDVSDIFTELMTDVDELSPDKSETITRKKTHTEILALREKLEAYGNPTYINAFDKLTSVERWKETDPNVFNRLVSDIGDGKYEGLDEVLDAMVELNINPDDWKAALTYYNAFEDDSKKGKMPIYQTNQTYKDQKKINLNAVKGNYMVQVGGAFIEKPNSWLAQSNADAYMNVEIIAFEKKYRDDNNGKEPTFVERNEFMETLKDILVKQFTDDNVSPNLKSFTDYEEELKVQAQVEKAKTEKYETTGVTQATENIYDKINLEEINFPAIVKEIAEDFDPSFLGLPLTGDDSKLGESDRESKNRFIEENLTKKLAEMFQDSGITDTMRKAMEQEDYNNLIKEISTRIESFSGTTVTPQMIDQMFNIIIGNQGT